MSNKTIDALVFCPFYFSEANASITCEGILENCSMVHRFPGKKEKFSHERDFCTSPSCVNCPAFLAIQSKYDERIKPYDFKT